MSGFDDFLARANSEPDRPDPGPTPEPERERPWQFTTVNTDVKKKAKVMSRMSRDGWEYVEETKNPLLSFRGPLALTFRRRA